MSEPNLTFPKNYTIEQIIAVLKDVQAGVSTQDLGCHILEVADEIRGSEASDGCIGYWRSIGTRSDSRVVDQTTPRLPKDLRAGCDGKGGE